METRSVCCVQFFICKVFFPVWWYHVIYTRNSDDLVKIQLNYFFSLLCDKFFFYHVICSGGNKLFFHFWKKALLSDYNRCVHKVILKMWGNKKIWNFAIAERGHKTNTDIYPFFPPFHIRHFVEVKYLINFPHHQRVLWLNPNDIFFSLIIIVYVEWIKKMIHPSLTLKFFQVFLRHEKNNKKFILRIKIVKWSITHWEVWVATGAT